MKISCIVALLATLCAATGINAQSMFRGDAMHSGTYAGPAPRQFHRVKWKFPTGDRVISSPVFKDNVIYFGGDDGNIYAVDAATGRQLWKRATGGPVPSTPAIANGTVYAGSYDGKFYALNAQTGALRWKFATEGERRFEAKGMHGWQPKNQTSPISSMFFSRARSWHRRGLFRKRRRTSLRARRGVGRIAVEIQNRRCCARFAGVRGWRSLFRKLGQLFLCGGRGDRQREMAVSRGRRSTDSQSGRIPIFAAVANGVVYTGCRDANLYALDAATGKEKWRFYNAMSWVISSPAVADGKVFFATSDSSLYHVVDAATGKPIVRQQDKAYMFSSPSVAGDVVFIGVLNGTLEARDRKPANYSGIFKSRRRRKTKAGS